MAKATVSLDKRNTDTACAVIRRAFDAGKNGTTGDHSDTGFLAEILKALDVEHK